MNAPDVLTALEPVLVVLRDLDVLGLLRVGRGRLDVPYLRHWAMTLRVIDLLERAIGQVV